MSITFNWSISKMQVTLTQSNKTNIEAQLTEQIICQLTQKQTEPTLPWAQIPA